MRCGVGTSYDSRRVPNMSSAISQPKISLRSRLSAWPAKFGVPFVVVLEITFGATQSNLFAAKPPVRKTERIASSEADDETFSPTAKISAPVGKGGKNEKQDVLLV